MYILSSRKNTAKATLFSETDTVWTIHDDTQYQLGTADKLLDIMRGKKTLLLIHDFNNSFDEVIAKYRAFQSQSYPFLGNIYDHIIGYVWTGGESYDGNFHVVQNANHSGKRLQQWLHQFHAAHSTVDVMSYNMAFIVAAEAINTKRKMPVRNFFSLGSILPINVLKSHAEPITNMLDNVRSLYLFYTEHDHTFMYPENAIGYPDPKNGTVFFNERSSDMMIDCSALIQEQVEYHRSEVIFEFIRKLLSGYAYPQHYVLTPGLRAYFNDQIDNYNADRMLSNKDELILIH